MDAFDRLVELGQVKPKRARELRAALERPARSWSPLLPSVLTRLQARFVSGGISRKECDRRIMVASLLWGAFFLALLSAAATAEMLILWTEGHRLSALRIVSRAPVSAMFVLVAIGTTFVFYLLGCLLSIPWNRQRRCLEDLDGPTGP